MTFDLLFLPEGKSPWGGACAYVIVGRTHGYGHNERDPRYAYEMLTSEGAFGFSLMAAAGKVRCGTPGYIAPEVYRCEKADVRSDIYSFGLVLWQMAVGSRLPPFIVPWRRDVESFLRAIYEQQIASRVPRVKGP